MQGTKAEKALGSHCKSSRLYSSQFSLTCMPAPCSQGPGHHLTQASTHACACKHTCTHTAYSRLLLYKAPQITWDIT